jgi:hypothetical protein
MASNISPSNIDGTYPVAGIDNDSQGFRTNFSNASTNFTFTKSEIEDLQSKVVLKSTLDGEVSVDNDMLGTVLQSPKLIDYRETIFNHFTVGATATINHQNGHYQILESTVPLTLSLSNFPGTGALPALGRVRVEMNITNVLHTVTMPASATNGVDFIDGYVGGVVTFAATGVYVFEFTTYDSATVTVSDLTRTGAGGAGSVGADGAPGVDGLSAYTIAVNAGFVGTESAWLTSLAGADGVGTTGATGSQGPIGVQGDQGDQGIQGNDGIQGVAGPVTPVSATVPTSSLGTTGDASGDLAQDGTFLYVCVIDYDGVTNIWRKVLMDVTPF